ncbi:MAG: carbohydrate porin [Akkermansiaceae bacterium]
MKKLATTMTIAFSGIALAAEEVPAFNLTEPTVALTDFERDTLTGDWDGARTKLANNGIKPFLYYDSIYAHNVSGGLDNGGEYAGQVYGGVDLDLEKIAGWTGTTAKISYVHRHGDTVNKHIGAVYDGTTIFGGQVSYLYQAYLETKFSDQWSIKYGRVSADNDFAKSSIYGFSSNTAINGPIRATLLENSITSFPYAVWGGRIKYNATEEHQYQLGVYQTGPDQWDFTNNGLNFDYTSDDGVSVLAQYDWTPKGEDTRVFAGVIASFRDFDRLDGTGQADGLVRFYAHGEKEISEGFKVFGLATWANKDEIAQTPVQISVGANKKGLFACRENDHTFFHATYGKLSDDYGVKIGKEVDYEIAYELGHRFQVTPYSYFQPAVQYIQNPGGAGDIDDAVVIGAWFNMAF